MTALRTSLRRGALGLLLAGLAAGGSVAPAAAAAPTWAELVVQADKDKGYAITDVTRRFALVIQRPMVRSAEIYRVRTTTPADAANVDALIDRLMASGMVSNVAPEPPVGINATRFHSWQKGRPVTVGTDPRAYLNQPIAADLSASHAISRGSGVTVAVLDTGADREHPALTGRLVAGYDYVDDDADPSERRQNVDTSGDGRRDSSYGHGTFLAGTVGLLAPGAQVLPMRVLDSDGVGNVVVIAQAIRDAVRLGAGVINLSFGTESSLNSPVLDRALRAAADAGALVVVAAGNAGSAQPLYPGASADVLSVTCFDPTTRHAPQLCQLWALGRRRGSRVRRRRTAARRDVRERGPGRRWPRPQVAAQAALIRSRAPAAQPDRASSRPSPRPRRALRPLSVQYGAVEIPASLSYASKP